MKEYEAYEKYDEWLDEIEGDIKIGILTFQASKILKELDPIAYDCGFSDFLDAEEIEIDEED